MNAFQCPECGYSNKLGSATCVSCLLVFEKHNKKVQGTASQIHGGVHLESLWQELLNNYENVEKHETFVKKALDEKKLPYASQQYRKMIDLNPHDEIASKMIGKIIQMATLTFALPRREVSRPQSRALRNISLLLFTIVIVLALFKIIF